MTQRQTEGKGRGKGKGTLDSSRFYFVNTIITLAVYGAIGLWAWRAAVQRARMPVT